MYKYQESTIKIFFFFFQTVLNKLRDVQLAMVIVRLYESDYDKQAQLMKDLLCRVVFGEDCTGISNMAPNVFEKTVAYSR